MSRSIEKNPQRAMVDALSAMVVDVTCVKVLACYDDGWGYPNRIVELARKVGQSLR